MNIRIFMSMPTFAHAHSLCSNRWEGLEIDQSRRHTSTGQLAKTRQACVDNSRALSDKEHCGKPRSYKAKQLTAEGEPTVTESHQ